MRTVIEPTPKGTIDQKTSSVRKRRRLVAVLGSVVGLAACGTDAPADSTTIEENSAPETIRIEMTDNTFNPNEITVPFGEPVRLEYYNAGQVIHNADAQEGAANSDAHSGHGGHQDLARQTQAASNELPGITLHPQQTDVSIEVFEQDATLYCHLHPNMIGKIVVDHSSHES